MWSLSCWFGSLLKHIWDQQACLGPGVFSQIWRSHRKAHSQTPGPCQSHPLGQFNLPANRAERPVSVAFPWKVNTKPLWEGAAQELAVCHQLSALSTISGKFFWERKRNQCWLLAHHFEQYLSLLFSRELHYLLFFCLRATTGIQMTNVFKKKW